MSRYAVIILILMIPAVALTASDTEQYGAVAGAIYPPMDAANLTGYIILTPQAELEGDTALKTDKSVPPIYIRRMFKGQFYVDSIPAGLYEAAINGVAYDSSFRLISRCIEQKLVGFRVAPDSASIVAHRLITNPSEDRQTRLMRWIEQIRPDTSEVLRIKGRYNDTPVFELYNDLTLPRHGYVFSLEPNIVDSTKIDGLTLALYSNRFFDGRENELRVNYNIAGDTILVEFRPDLLADSSTDYRYRQPLYKLANIPYLESCRYIRFSGDSTTLYEISFDSDEIILDLLEDEGTGQPREVYYFSRIKHYLCE